MQSTSCVSWTIYLPVLRPTKWKARTTFSNLGEGGVPGGGGGGRNGGGFSKCQKADTLHKHAISTHMQKYNHLY